jgi:hypothetical protein
MTDEQRNITNAAQNAATTVAAAAQTAANAVATAAATAAAATSLDISYIKKDISEIKIAVKEIKDSLLERIIKLETRMDAQDVYHAAIPLKKYDDLANWGTSFRSNYKIILTIGGILVGLIGAAVDQLLQHVVHF